MSIGFYRPNGADHTSWLIPSRYFEFPKTEETMRKLAEAAGYRAAELEGFTLFFHQGKGWQMSIRRKGENGWSIQFISDDEAKSVFSLLGPIDHPNSPYNVKLPAPEGNSPAVTPSRGLLTALGDLNAAITSLSATLSRV